MGKILIYRSILCFLCFACLFAELVSSEESSNKITPIGIVDTYYSLYEGVSQNSLHNGFTQPIKNNIPSLNLISLGLESSGRVNSRLIFQAGNSVDENYSSEKHNNIKYIQEANITLYLHEKLSLTSGIYSGHIGSESFVSTDNLAYTRSFHAEYSPYYQRGFRFRYQQSERLKYEVHLISGYQELSESRILPALGTLVQFGKDGENQVSHALYLMHRDGGTRALNDFVVKLPITSKLQAQFIGDVGVEDSRIASGVWGNVESILSYQILESLAVVLRAEKMIDHDRVISTFSQKPLDMNGFSFGLNYVPYLNTFLRTEVRAISASNRIFSEDNSAQNKNNFFVTSLGYKF